jgi:type II secretory pathway pseudopilin PulG
MTYLLQVLQQQKDKQLQQQLQQFQSIQQQQQQQRMATSSAVGLTPVPMPQQTLSSLQVSAAGGQLLQQQVLTSSPSSGNVVMTGRNFTYFAILFFTL